MNNELTQMRSFLVGGGIGSARGSIGITPSAPKSKYDYGRLIRQKEEEIIELVHAYNNSKAGFASASSSSGRATHIKIADFRRLFLG